VTAGEAQIPGLPPQTGGAHLKQQAVLATVAHQRHQYGAGLSPVSGANLALGQGRANAFQIHLSLLQSLIFVYWM
jgi:hypothetical protein